MKKLATAALFVALSILPGTVPASADDPRPVSLQLTESEPGVFRVQWKVPLELPVQAMPVPELPPDCEPAGESESEDRPDGRRLRRVFACEGPLYGREVGLSYPLYNPSLEALVRVDFLSGESFARVLGPDERSWTLPESRAADPRALLGALRDTGLVGLRHSWLDPVHLVLAVALALWSAGLGPTGSSAISRSVGWFSAGHLGGASFAFFSGSVVAAGLGEAGVGLAAVVILHRFLREPGEATGLSPVLAAAGLFHGLALPLWLNAAVGEAGWIDGVGAVATADAGLLSLTLGLYSLLRWIGEGAGRWRELLAYGVGACAVALTLVAVLDRNDPRSPRAREDGRVALADGAPMEAPTSRRVAPRAVDAPLQSFVAVGAFEVRHEVLVRVADVVDLTAFATEGSIPVEAQEAVLAEVVGLVDAGSRIDIDDASATPASRQASFMTWSDQGARPRVEPIPEDAREALVGVTREYLASETPSSVELRWDVLPPRVERLPVALTDPEGSLAGLLSRGRPALRWTNELERDPRPTIRAVEREPRLTALPVASLTALAVLALSMAALRRFGRHRHRPRGAAGPIAPALVTRLSLALAVLLAPTGAVLVALPSLLPSAPSEQEARRILAGVLPNVYRAFEYRREREVYDRLALTVDGEILTRTYLEHRRALEMEERGGARARVESVEVTSAGSVEGIDGGAFRADAAWTVGGMVTHFGHRHFRRNRYQASVEVAPVDGVWKIRALDVLEEERLQ